MSLLVAIPFGVASAVAYGFSTAVQHQAAHNDSGEVDPRGLVRLLRDPRWLLSIGGDLVGFLLQVVALSTGPVVMIQPLLVLTLPVSLAAGYLLGGPRPRASDYSACLAIVGGLSLFFVLLGEPGIGSPPTVRDLITTVVVELIVGIALCLAVARRSSGLRAGIYGGVAGVWFGTIGVMLNSAATQFRAAGLGGLLGDVAGLVPLVALGLLGAVGMTLTQMSFQVGPLAASFPANKCADPVAAVVLGAVLLHEHVPGGAAHLLTYLVCLAAIIGGAIRLATPPPSAFSTPVRHNMVP